MMTNQFNKQKDEINIYNKKIEILIEEIEINMITNKYQIEKLTKEQNN